MSNAQPFVPESDSRQAAASNPIGSPRNFALACIGLLSLLADEIPALVERSVQRGSAVARRAQTEAGDEWQTELSRLGLLTHHDLETLLQQVTELERQIDQLAAQRSAAP